MSRSDSRVRELVERSEALELIAEAALGLGVAVRVVGLDGGPFGTPAEQGAPTDPVRIGERVGASPAAEIAGVELLDERVGYVVAEPASERAREEGSGLTRRLAERTAHLLGLLCSREFELDDLSREILDAYEELNLFYDLSGELAGASDLGTVAERILGLARRAIAPRCGWVLGAPERDGPLRVVASFGLPGDGPDALEPVGLAAEAIRTRVAQVVEVEQADARSMDALERTASASILVVPLAVPGDTERPVLGALVLADRADGGAELLTAADLKLAHALASQAALLLENARLIKYERELELARGIQASLLPPEPPTVPHLDVAGRCLPASNVGGDYYDHVLLPDGRLVLLVADVSGHNLAAALIQTAARAALRAAIQAGGGAAEMLDRTNRTLHDDLTRAELFLTAFVGIVEPDGRTLTFADAGHNPTLRLRASTGEVESLSTNGLPIGVLPDGMYDEQRIELAPDDVLLVYTDGLTEARSPDGAEFGEDGLADSLVALSAGSAAEIVDGLLSAVDRHSARASAGDDRTLVVLKPRGASAR